MTRKELMAALRNIATDRHCCFGCGYEHNCGLHGCAVIRAALEALEQQETPEEIAALRGQLARANEDQRRRDLMRMEDEIHNVNETL